MTWNCPEPLLATHGTAEDRDKYYCSALNVGIGQFIFNLFFISIHLNLPGIEFGGGSIVAQRGVSYSGSLSHCLSTHDYIDTELSSNCLYFDRNVGIVI